MPIYLIYILLQTESCVFNKSGTVQSILDKDVTRMVQKHSQWNNIKWVSLDLLQHCRCGYQQIHNCLAGTLVKAPKSSHITPILGSLHWLKINKRIEYKLLSLTHKVLTTSQPDYLHNLISVQSTGRTRSSSVVTLAQHLWALACVCFRFFLD